VDLTDLAQAEQRYERNTAIVEPRCAMRTAAPFASSISARGFRTRGRMFRPMMLIRIVEPVAGRPLVHLRLRPTARYGASADPAIPVAIICASRRTALTIASRRTLQSVPGG